MNPTRPIRTKMTLCESPPAPAALLLVAWGSYMTPSQPEYTKTQPQTGGSSYFLIENRLKQHFFFI
jgi:hypothetical protein